MKPTFGLDFGTTNSLISIVNPGLERGQVRSTSILSDNGKPHPSAVRYDRDPPVVGAEALENLNVRGLGVFGNVVRSPKMFLGSPNDIVVGGIRRTAPEVTGDILKHLRNHALTRNLEANNFECAVMSVPVAMTGAARTELREAARLAGIEIHQFIHEPLAALYGHLRAMPNHEFEMARLDRHQVLVFDWGGGTLDLTLCEIRDGIVAQVFSQGSFEVGGDRFDDRIIQLVRDKFMAAHPRFDWNALDEHSHSRLSLACEDAKITLSGAVLTTVFLKDFGPPSGRQHDLYVELTRNEVNKAVEDLVDEGIGTIRKILSRAGVSPGSIEFCLVTGGQSNMPEIEHRLNELFGPSRISIPSDRHASISQGAAWIAYDNATAMLAKPFEILHADGAYIKVFKTGQELPVGLDSLSSKLELYCVNPRDGSAKLIFARPKRPGREAHGESREIYEVLTLPVDRTAKPLEERLELTLEITEDLIVEISAYATGCKQSTGLSVHDLEFGLRLGAVIEPRRTVVY